MKIAFALFKYFPHGGLQLDTLRLVTEAAKRGHRAVLFVYEVSGDLPEIPGAEMVILPVKAASNHGRALEFEEKFHQAIQEAGDFDVTVAMNRIRGCDYYFAADNCLALEFRKKHSELALKLLPRYRKFLAQEEGIFAPTGKTRIFYIAEQQYQDFTRVYHTGKERFIALPPGIPEKYRGVAPSPEAREALRREFKISSDKLVLISIGANFQLKGFDRAVKLIAALPAELRQKVVYLATGPDKSRQIAALAATSGIAEQVIFTGGRDDTPQLLSGADMMIHLPRSEAAGSVIAEALCCGLPVLCTGNCGFAPLAAAAGCPTIPGDYDEKIAAELCCKMLNDLDRYRASTAGYSAATDFFGRAERAISVIETACR